MQNLYVQSYLSNQNGEIYLEAMLIYHGIIHQIYIIRGGGGDKYLAGTYNFRVTEMEVFRI